MIRISYQKLFDLKIRQINCGQLKKF